jgi:RHS repeat-associated protein
MTKDIETGSGVCGLVLEEETADETIAHIYDPHGREERTDDTLGLVYYNYRHYNPLDGRWTSRDPIEEEGGINLMCFCHNAMTSIADSLGCGLLDYLPFISTVRNIIDSFIGHIPGESPTDYSVASPKDCKCNSLVAEAKCTARIQKEIISYSAQVLSSAVIARGVDFIVTTLMLNVNPFVAAAFFTDGIIGAYLNQRIYAKILEGAALAERNNCSCDQYGIH